MNTISRERKKEAITRFKERKTLLGIFAVRCAASGQIWVGSSRNLEAAKNAIWFSLRLGIHREKRLQNEWNVRGSPNFEFETLEKLEEDAPAMLVPDLLRDAKQRWIAQLNAHSLL